MVRIFVLIAVTFLNCDFLKASEKDTKDSVKVSQAIMAGGMLANGESYLMGKYEYLINNAGLQISMTREAMKRNINFDSSQDKYLRAGYGLTFRYYVPDVVRGFFGGAALSSTTANLITTFQDNKEAKACTFLNSGGIELGYRIGGKRKGFIGEVGYRRMYTFNKVRLTTNDNITFSDINDGVSPHAWNLQSGDYFEKFFIGLGYVF